MSDKAAMGQHDGVITIQTRYWVAQCWRIKGRIVSAEIELAWATGMAMHDLIKVALGRGWAVYSSGNNNIGNGNMMFTMSNVSGKLTGKIKVMMLCRGSCGSHQYLF